MIIFHFRERNKVGNHKFYVFCHYENVSFKNVYVTRTYLCLVRQSRQRIGSRRKSYDRIRLKLLEYIINCKIIEPYNILLSQRVNGNFQFKQIISDCFLKGFDMWPPDVRVEKINYTVIKHCGSCTFCTFIVLKLMLIQNAAVIF